MVIRFEILLWLFGTFQKRAPGLARPLHHLENDRGDLGLFLEGAEKFSHRKSRSRMSNLVIAALFSTHILTMNRGYATIVRAFSSPEAARLLVSTKNHDLWPVPTPESDAYAQSQV